MSKTVREAASELGVSRQTVYSWIRKAQSSGVVKLDSQSVKGGQALTVTDEQITAMKSAFQGVDCQVNCQVDSQDDSQACKAVKAQIDSLTAQNEQLEKENAALTDQLRAANERISMLTDQISAADDRIREQSNQIREQNDQIRQLITLTDQAQKLNAATARQLEDLQQQRQRRGLRGLIDKLRGNYAEDQQ